jgi:hypothetical protein
MILNGPDAEHVGAIAVVGAEINVIQDFERSGFFGKNERRVEESRAIGDIRRAMKLQAGESGCPSIGNQCFRNSGFRRVADPRYQSCDFVRQTTIFYDRARWMVASKPCRKTLATPSVDCR